MFTWLRRLLFPSAAEVWDKDGRNAMDYARSACRKYFAHTIPVEYRVPVQKQAEGTYGGYRYVSLQGRKVVGWVPLADASQTYVVKQDDRWLEREIMKHEFGHVYRYLTDRDWTHTPELSPYFLLWGAAMKSFAGLCRMRLNNRARLHSIKVDDCMADEIIIE